MGNPWAPPDNSTPPAGAAPQQPTPAHGPAGDAHAPGTSAPPPGTVHPGAHPQTPGAPQPPHGGPQPPHGGPGAPPPVRPVGPPPDPAGVLRSTRTAAWSAGVLLIAVLLTGAPYPAMLAAPLAALGSLALAILAVVRGARAHGRGSVVALPVTLLVAALGWTVVSGASLLYVDAARDYQQCSAGALTQQAKRACAEQLDQDMEDRLGSITGLVGTPRSAG